MGMNLLPIVCLLALGPVSFVVAEPWERLAPLPDPLGVAAPFAGVSNGVRSMEGPGKAAGGPK